MNSTIEIKAMGLALFVALLSLSGFLLISIPIKMQANSDTHGPDTSSSPSSSNVISSPELVAQGRQFFTMSCVECHGDDAHGDEGPDLHHLTISNAALAVMIKQGEKNQMPSFTKKYSDAQVAALVAYLRSLH
jgi:cytochrome c553